MDRLATGGNNTGAWKRTKIQVRDRQSQTFSGYVTSSGNHAVYSDGGGRFRIYDMKTQKTVKQGHGGDLTFNKLKDAKAYAATL